MQKSGVLWVNLPQDQRDHIKSHLPDLILREQKYASSFTPQTCVGFGLIWEKVSLFGTQLPG